MTKDPINHGDRVAVLDIDGKIMFFSRVKAFIVDRTSGERLAVLDYAFAPMKISRLRHAS